MSVYHIVSDSRGILSPVVKTCGCWRFNEHDCEASLSTVTLVNRLFLLDNRPSLS